MTFGSLQPVYTSPQPAQSPKLLDRVRQTIRTRHLSRNTEQAYIGWIKRFIFFHNKRHPLEMGEQEIGQFLSSLACDSHLSASTQNQGLNALLFLYHEVLEWQWTFPATSHYTDTVTREKRRHHLHESVLQRAFKEATLKAGLSKPATCHALRHSFATHLSRSDHSDSKMDMTFGLSKSYSGIHPVRYPMRQLNARLKNYLTG